MAEKNLSNVKIIFTDKAFDKEIERSGFHDFKKYTANVKTMNEIAEKLDRFDDFADLTLLSTDYAKGKESDVYGIPKKDFHRGKERLLPNQIKAVQSFLRELRGFGLLADVVGTGKTYEALAALSELAAKGKVSSALFIVPKQVYAKWVNVAECEFGLGVGILKQVKKFDINDYELSDDGFYASKQPVIVSSEDFVTWKEEQLQDVLYDVVIVDEAHNLCSEEGESAKALKLLAILMETKKRAKKTYCILLSATPHSGNLEQMFRLWYFIRCQGGNPSDFDVKADDKRTPEYRKEKEYYKMHICRGASTVMEFINNVRQQEIEGQYRKQFMTYLSSINISESSYNNLLVSEKRNLILDFLENNEKLNDQVNSDIAAAYHSGVLRSIMIRQPSTGFRKAKNIDNTLFFPTTKIEKVISIIDYNNQEITIDIDQISTDKAVFYKGNNYSLKDYIYKYPGNYNFSDAYSRILQKIFAEYNLTNDSFEKKGSLRFYSSLLQDSEIDRSDRKIQFVPFNGDIFDAKMSKLKQILNENKNSRVIIFFDYDIEDEKIVDKKVVELLQKDNDVKNRLILGNSADKESINQEFDKKEDAVLIVQTAALTEGTDFQTCNIVVNFQVTPDPLAMEQRVGRIFRLGQKNDITIYSLADMTDLEGYVLMYFTTIGLMNSNTGDAAIIAGSNNDNMVTIRCDVCGRVKLLGKDEYEEYKKNEKDFIYCTQTPSCRQSSSKGRLMVEINSNELKCNTCGALLKRHQSGTYLCLTNNGVDQGVMCNQGEVGDRQLYCKKICSIAHCDRFISGEMKNKCDALKEYRENKNISDADLFEICDSCEYRDECGKCCVGVKVDAIRPCVTCDQTHMCNPRPHIIEFALDKWEAPCPVCLSKSRLSKKNIGKLKPVVARTFDTFVRGLYSFNQVDDDSFTRTLEKETVKVSQIQRILADDQMREDN